MHSVIAYPQNIIILFIHNIKWILNRTVFVEVIVFEIKKI